jgi:putative ABC transport system substrate-binding protein
MDRRRLVGGLAGGTLLSLAGFPALGHSHVKRLAVFQAYYEKPMSAQEKAEYAQEFESHGYRLGQNLEIQWYEFPVRGATAQRGPLLKKMLASQPDCIAVVSEAEVRPLMAATRTVPIVASVGVDPVASGFAASLQHPGGNVTGLHGGQREVLIKRLELLKAFQPKLACVAWIAFGGQLPWYPMFEAVAAEAGLRSRQVLIEVSDMPQLARLRRELSRLRAQGCIAGHFHSGLSEAIAAVAQSALEHKLAISYGGEYEPWKTEGLLFRYAARTRRRGQSPYERSAAVIARIFRGERPGDIAFEGPTGYDLYVNARTAARIGLAIPPQAELMANEILR